MSEREREREKEGEKERKTVSEREPELASEWVGAYESKIESRVKVRVRVSRPPNHLISDNGERRRGGQLTRRQGRFSRNSNPFRGKTQGHAKAGKASAADHGSAQVPISVKGPKK